MGDFEVAALAVMESSLKYHPYEIENLTWRYFYVRICPAFGRPDSQKDDKSIIYSRLQSNIKATSGTMSGGQFDWGGRLPKSNGGAQRFPQHGWKSCEECKGIRELDCKTNESSRDESRA